MLMPNIKPKLMQIGNISIAAVASLVPRPIPSIYVAYWAWGQDYL